MKVELENVTLGFSELTGKVYAGTLNKSGKTWRNKIDVTNEFLNVVLHKFEGNEGSFEDDDNFYHITIQTIKKTP